MPSVSKRTKTILIIVVLLLPTALIIAVTSVFDFSPDSIEVSELKWVQVGEPERDAKAALELRDFHLLGISDRDTHAPGLNAANYSKCAGAFGVSAIKHTTEPTKDERLAKLIELAKEYALKYNRIILSEAPRLNPKLPANCADRAEITDKKN